MDVVAARTPESLRLALRGLGGGLSERVRACRSQIIDVLAYLTALVDFPEDEVGVQDVDAPLRDALTALDALLTTAGQGAVLRQGVRVAIVGLPNAGKSSLLNRLLGWERAIVASQPGTTRDTLEETLNLRGIPFVLTDTAGIRAVDDPVEHAGVERSREQAAAAAIVLWVVDGSTRPEPALGALAEELAGRTVLAAINKADLPPACPPHALAAALGSGGAPPWAAVSAHTGQGIDELADRLCALALGGAAPADDTLLVANPRHAAALQRARDHVAAARSAHDAGEPTDLLTIDLTAAVQALGEITGESATDDLLDRIFSRFCIGK
jgi:tRNA modification GTPase